MALFGKKKPDVSNEAELAEIEASVRNIRGRMGQQKMPLGDLFALMNEDERAILSIIPRKAAEAEERLLPDQVLSTPRKGEPKTAADSRSNELFFKSL